MVPGSIWCLRTETIIFIGQLWFLGVLLFLRRCISLFFRRKVQEINWQRKQEQTHAGETLTELEEEWVTLVGKNYEIEQAIIDLEQELQISAASLEAGGNGDITEP